MCHVTDASDLVDRVLPYAPMRQWVLSLPRWARFLLARDAALQRGAAQIRAARFFRSPLVQL